MQKSLFIARALARQGWRVVVVEEEGWGLLSPARFSRFVDAFRLVPSGGGQRYVDALVSVARAEDVDLFVPCSGAGTTHEDALAAEVMRRERGGMGTKVDKEGFQAIIQDPELVLELHEKVRPSDGQRICAAPDTIPHSFCLPFARTSSSP